MGGQLGESAEKASRSSRWARLQRIPTLCPETVGKEPGEQDSPSKAPTVKAGLDHLEIGQECSWRGFLAAGAQEVRSASPAGSKPSQGGQRGAV